VAGTRRESRDGSRIHSEDHHPVSRFLHRIYEPVCEWSLRRKWVVIGIAVGMMAATVPVFLSLGSEFMPSLDEGSLFYMPSTMPGISITEAQRLLQLTDGLIHQFPEVDRVLGKAGRADTATDPAPLSMLETVITLKPKSQWRRVPTWYSAWSPEWLKPLFRHLTPDHISREELVNQLDAALRLPGVSSAWTMPVKARIDMLTTGIRTPVGLKIYGGDPAQIEAIGARVEAMLQGVRGTRSVFSERTGAGYFLDFTWKREELARYGLKMEEAQEVIASAIGGDSVTTTLEGRARYPVNVRYLRDFRSDLEALKRVLVPVQEGKKQIPLAQLAEVKVTSGPAMLRDEDGLLTGYVYVDIGGRDVSGYVEEARRVVEQQLSLPAGYSIRWSGQYEAMERVRGRLLVVVPATLLLILFLLYVNTRSVVKTLVVVLAVPFSAIGAFWFLWLMGYNLSIAVWVGLIALLGVDAETGVFMLLYLDLAYAQAKREGRLNNVHELRQAILAGAVKRLRPKFMTASTMLLGLVPILWATGTGSDVMKRIATPMIGGIFTSFLLELLVYPAIYEVWKWHFGENRATVKVPALAACGENEY
jgi:Cu(I)/Ag(I) efflux system membrane protein CusA/SilA